jgi:hypothetical protein
VVEHHAVEMHPNAMHRRALAQAIQPVLAVLVVTYSLVPEFDRTVT